MGLFGFGSWLRKKKSDSELERDGQGMPEYGPNRRPAFGERVYRAGGAFRHGLAGAGGFVRGFDRAITPERARKAVHGAQRIKSATDAILFSQWGMEDANPWPSSGKTRGRKKHRRSGDIHIHIHQSARKKG